MRTHYKGIEGHSDDELIRKITTAKSTNEDTGLSASQLDKPVTLESANSTSKYSDTENAVIVEELSKQICRITGVQDLSLASAFVSETEQVLAHIKFPKESDRMHAAALMLGEIGPKNATECLLAIQMIGVHHAAILFLKNACVNQSNDICGSNVARATRLMRLFNEQVEAMAKLKGKTAQQKVTVEHVHVNSGVQAIVGAVTAGRGDTGEGGK